LPVSAFGSFIDNGCIQLIRDGNHSVADLMAIGKTMLGRRHVLPSVVSSLAELMVEGTFPSGTYLVTVHHPISSDHGDLEKALYGSFLPIPDTNLFPLPDPKRYDRRRMPGAVIPVKEGNIIVKGGRRRIKLKVVSKGDRPIQVQHPIHGIQAIFNLLTGIVGWLTLSLNRSESPARFRSSQSLWLFP